MADENENFEFTMTKPAEPEPTPKEEVVQAAAPEPELTPEPEKAAEPKHPIDLVSQAARLEIDPDEMESMTTGELRVMVRTLERMQRMTPAKQETVVEQEADINPFEGIDESTLLPEFLGPIKKLAEEIKGLKAENKALRQDQQSVASQSVDQRVNGIIESISPGLSKKFVGERKQELYGMLGAMLEGEKRAGRMLDEPTRVKRAIAALDMLPVEKKESKKEAAFKKAEEEYEAGALSAPVNRKTDLDVYQQVDRILKRPRRSDGEAAYKPVFND